MKVPLLKAGALSLLFGILHWLDLPADPGVRLCGFFWLTGRPCPLCGMTRALFALGKGRWYEAIAFHALSPLALLLLASLFWGFPGRDRLWTVGLAAIGIFGLVRMVSA